VNRSSRTVRYSHGVAAGVLLFCGRPGVPAEPPPGAATGTSANPPASEVQALAPQGGFLSSLKQGFAQDLEREVVRGHFDVSLASGTQRYYCLLDPKTGKSEANAVSGQLVSRRDGMTGIKGAAVTFYRCADAEQKGMLVTSGYLVSRGIGGGSSRAALLQGPPRVDAPRVPAPAAGLTRAEVLAAYTRFIAGQNAHDRAAVSDVLLNSDDFVWTQHNGNSVWGYQEAMDAFAKAWEGIWRLDPQLNELRIAEVSPGVAVLITPLLFTGGAPAESPSAVPVRWGGVFVKTKSGWRISSIFITPLERGHARPGS
jgi:hypothetical protein